MRTPLRLQAPNAHTEDLINTVQTLYLLEKINKKDIARAAQEYMDIAYQNITTPGLLLLLRYGVYVQYVHPLSLAHLAQPDGAGYASRAWALMGYKPAAINNKVIRDYPGMQRAAQAILQHAEAHPGQWSQIVEVPGATTLLSAASESVANVALDDGGNTRHLLLFGRGGQELHFFDAYQGERTCHPNDLRDRISTVRIHSTTPF